MTMKRMTKLEMDTRQALGDLNNNGVDVPWLVSTMREGYHNATEHKGRLYAQIDRMGEDYKVLKTMIEAMDLGDECPKGMGTLMVSNEAYQKLKVKINQMVAAL